MNVLSLFDGISCGRIALERAGIPVANYFASEIDKNAIDVSRANWTDIKHLGDVKNISLLSENWTEKTYVINYKIDLLIGGSPCQGFSFAGKQLNFKDERSKLFFEFVRLLNEAKEINPNVLFLLENVMMKKEYQNIISESIGCHPIMINSALVSAQNRKRLYWTNIPNITHPKHTEWFLKDIIEYDADPVTLTETRTDEAKLIRKEYSKLGRDFSPRRAKILVKRIDNKSNCLTATRSLKEHLIKLKKGLVSEILIDGDYYRPLLPIEWERLQCLPLNYTSKASIAQRYKLIGNGWNVNTITHIFKNIPI